MAEISSFDFARLAALKQYSDLESQLCLIMKYALGTDYQAAATVFYGITNTRGRYAIIDRLLAGRDEGAYCTSWDWISRKVGVCDVARNELVHWTEDRTIVVNISGDRIGDVAEQPMLKNPKGSGDNSVRHYESDIWKKRDEMRVMLHIVNRFWLTLYEPLVWPSWRDRFRQPIGRLTPTEFLQLLNLEGSPARLPPYPRKLLPLFPRHDDHRPDIQVEGK